MKILELKKQNVYDIGFIDPCKVNEELIRTKPEETEENLQKFFLKNWCSSEILLPYNFR